MVEEEETLLSSREERSEDSRGLGDHRDVVVVGGGKRAAVTRRGVGCGAFVVLHDVILLELELAMTRYVVAVARVAVDVVVGGARGCVAGLAVVERCVFWGLSRGVML